MVADTTPEFSPAALQPAHGTVGFVRGCAMSVMFGDTNASTVRLLNAAGFHVISPREQVCCGALFAHGGRLDLAREYAARNIAAFGKNNVEAIVTNAAGCGSTLKDYGHLLAEDANLRREAGAFGGQVQDLTEFLVKQGFASREFRRSSERVTYHDACHLAHPQRITSQPRQLVRAVARENYVELPESDVCCGSAGTYNLTQPEMAEELQRRKVENILASGASTVVTTNPGCILQIRSGLEKASGGKIRVVHIADYLSAALPAD
jgi:glycolate oxidase iron-sulfur subunit